jgi:hypothetical protein
MPQIYVGVSIVDISTVLKTFKRNGRICEEILKQEKERC